MTRPIDRFLPTAAQEVALARFEFTTTWNCYQSAGYRVADPEPSNYPAFVTGQIKDLVVRSDVYGFFDTDTVASYGYLRPPAVPGHVEVADPIGVPAEVVATCQRAGVNATTAATREQLPHGGPSLATNDARVVSARGQWSACMQKRGLDIKDPIDAISQHLTSSPGDIAVAQADVACKQQTNFVGIATGVQAALDNAYVTANLPALTTYATAVAATLVRAAAAK